MTHQDPELQKILEEFFYRFEVEKILGTPVDEVEGREVIFREEALNAVREMQKSMCKYLSQSLSSYAASEVEREREKVRRLRDRGYDIEAKVLRQVLALLSPKEKEPKQ